MLICNNMLIQSLNQTWLENIIQSLNMVFHSEAHFQFCLAWEIKKHFNCNVILEDYTASVKDPNGKIIQKLYTDIVVEDVDCDFRIAIEVKYKTALFSQHGVYLFNHGAQPLARYDFLKDVERVEGLVLNTSNVQIIKRCNIGFSIMLTNDNSYWNIPTIPLKTIDKNIRIHQGNVLNGDLDWYPVNPCPKTIIRTKRSKTLHLTGNYTCKWKPYINYSIPNGEFKYLILSYPNNAKSTNSVERLCD